MGVMGVRRRRTNRRRREKEEEEDGWMEESEGEDSGEVESGTKVRGEQSRRTAMSTSMKTDGLELELGSSVSSSSNVTPTTSSMIEVGGYLNERMGERKGQGKRRSRIRYEGRRGREHTTETKQRKRRRRGVNADADEDDGEANAGLRTGGRRVRGRTTTKRTKKRK